MKNTISASVRKTFSSMRYALDFVTMTAKGVKPVNCSDGNKKLIPNNETAFLVFNLPAVKTCPFRTAHCEKLCYAKKAETAYPDCLPARARNFADSLRDDFVERMIYTILKKLRYDRKLRKLVVRIHESGDFYNREYADKWLAIADYFKSEKRVVFICYTKSFPYFDGVKLPHNFRLRASVWDDTKPEFITMISANNWSTYTAVDAFRKGDKFTRCRCSDCATCGKCWARYKDIRCEIH